LLGHSSCEWLMEESLPHKKTKNKEYTMLELLLLGFTAHIFGFIKTNANSVFYVSYREYLTK